MAGTSVTSNPTTVMDDSDRPQQRPTLIRCVVVSWVVMFVGVSIPLALYMDSWVNGFTVGFFTALWGGPGFGLMAGMALHTLHTENWEKKHGIVH